MILRLHQPCLLHTTEPNSPSKVRLTMLETNLVFPCLRNTPFWLQIVKCKKIQQSIQNVSGIFQEVLTNLTKKCVFGYAHGYH